MESRRDGISVETVGTAQKTRHEIVPSLPPQPIFFIPPLPCDHHLCYLIPISAASPLGSSDLKRIFWRSLFMYTKPHLSFEEQVNLLQERGLVPLHTVASFLFFCLRTMILDTSAWGTVFSTLPRPPRGAGKPPPHPTHVTPEITAMECADVLCTSRSLH